MPTTDTTMTRLAELTRATLASSGNVLSLAAAIITDHTDAHGVLVLKRTERDGVVTDWRHGTTDVGATDLTDLAERALEHPSTVDLEVGSLHTAHHIVSEPDGSCAFIALATDPFEAADRDTIAAVAGILDLAAQRDGVMATHQRTVADFADAQELASFGTYDWHIPSDTNTWSDQLYRIYGAEPGSFNASYERFLGFIHPDDRERIQDVHAKAFETLEPYHTVERIIREDGEVRWLSTSGEIVANEQGTPVRVAGVCVDITEQHRAAEQVQHAAERMTELLGASPDALLLVGANGKIDHANRQAVDLFGYETDELEGMKVDELVPDEFRDGHGALRAGFHAAPRKRPMGVGLELSARRRDGSTVSVDIHLSPLRGDDGRVAVFIRDASQRLEAQELGARLSAVEARRRQALEINDNVVQGLASAAYALESGQLGAGRELVAATLSSARSMMDDLLAELSGTALDAEHLVRDAPSASAIFASPDTPSAPEAAAQPRVLLVDDAEDIRLLLRIGLEAEGFTVVAEAGDGIEGLELAAKELPDIVLLDLAMPRMDGLTALPQLRELLPNATIVVLSGFGEARMAEESRQRGADIYLEKGQPIAALVEYLSSRHPTAADADAAPVADDAAHEAGSIARTEFAIASLAHELRTPLTVISGMVETLRSPAIRFGDEQHDTVLAAMERNVRHMRALLDNVNESHIARRGRIVVSPETIDLTDALEGIAKDVSALFRGRAVDLDLAPGLVITVDPVHLRQMVTNLLSNAAKFCPPDARIALRATSVGNTAEITVEDDGRGIPTKDLAKLFRPYERLDGGRGTGMGLGLFLSRELARAHGGDLTYDVNVPGGNTFRITLPTTLPAKRDLGPALT